MTDQPKDRPYQVLPPLSDAEREALRESIATFGVLQAVITDEQGQIIEGHHRAEIADELGIDYPTVTLPGLTEQQKVEQALALNMGRRHLTTEQKAALVADLRARGLSIRWISDKTGIPRSTVQRLTGGVPDGTPGYRGKDGKRRQAQATPSITAIEQWAMERVAELQRQGVPKTIRIPATIEEAAVRLNELAEDDIAIGIVRTLYGRMATEIEDEPADEDESD